MDLRRLQNDPSAFRASLLIDADGTPRRLGECLDDWQRRDFEALDPAWRSVAGQDVGDVVRRGWLERPRGHSKTSDIACSVCFALFASRRAIRGVCAAGDADQAGLLKDAVSSLLRLNPWLNSILTVQASKILNKHTGAELEILTSDAPTSYGLLVDFIVCDEVTHWRKRDLWDSLLSSAAKRRNCLLLVISNAGFQDSWQWKTREAIRQDPSWYFSRQDGPVASWITADRLAEQARLLPTIPYRRLWLNVWSGGSGDAITPEDIDGALQRGNRQEAMGDGWAYVAGLDLGLSRDASALVTAAKHTGYCEIREAEAQCLSRHQRIMIELGEWVPPSMVPEFILHPGTGRLKVVDVRVWKPENNRKVDIGQIEEAIIDASEKYEGLKIGADPWQSAYLQERLRVQGIQIEAVDFTGSNLKSMCSAVLEAFSESNITLPDDPRLLSDLRSLRVEERSYGCRLVSPRGPGGHGDAATGLAIALHLARQTREVTSTRLNRPLLCFP